MRKSKFLMACVATLALTCAVVPASANAQEAEPVAAGEETENPGEITIEPRKDNIYWRYKIENGKVYKRLFNYSRNMWVGDWIFVKYLD